MSRTAALCQSKLATGKTCRQVTLKGESLCRHHRRLFRHSEADARQEQAMERLAAELSSLSLPHLLHALYAKLSAIRTTLRSHPEAQLALAITFHRLQEQLEQAAPKDRPPTPMNFPECPAESMNYSQSIS
jgi:hypothetical protein